MSKELKLDTTNPFNEGVSYEAFLENVKGKVTLDGLLKKHDLSKEKIDWLKEELNNFKKNKK
jgi:hypothetical protein